MPDDTTDTYDDDDQDTQPGQVTLNRKQIRSLERDAKRAQDSDAKAADLERRLAFAEAGIKSTDPKMSYFVKGYDGEMTAEAITKAAQEAGFLAAAEQDTDTKAELDAHDRVSAASAGTPGRSDSDKVAKLRQAADEGGRAGLLAQLAADGRVVV